MNIYIIINKPLPDAMFYRDRILVYMIGMGRRHWHSEIKRNTCACFKTDVFLYDSSYFFENYLLSYKFFCLIINK